MRLKGKLKMSKPAGRRSGFRISFGRLIGASIALVAILIVPLAYSRSTAFRTLFTRQKPQTRGPVVRKSPATRGTGTQSGTVKPTDQISEEGMRQIAALMEEKASRTPAQQKMDSQLLQA